ncbi:MAG: HD domain-containing protein [Fimbriimonadaceae bacterium]|nr:HD domain-containing protein [Fimbriimonadaceae bacterium]
MNTRLSSRFVDALQFALKLHGEQTRKGTDIPYVSHLLGVASIVLEHGGSEDEAIAALLHDAGEDSGGQATIDDIRHRFGDTVADLVLGCTDTLEEPKPNWRIRKEAYIAHLAEADRSMCLVSAADKLHNARSIEHDYRVLGESLWSRFRGGKDGTLWYYRTLTEAFRSKELGSLVDDLNAVVSRIEQMSQEP